MHSKRSKEGYLLIDHKASPGLPKDFMKNLGLNTPSVVEGSNFEGPTYTCCRCGIIVIMNPLRTRERGYCHKHDAYICDSPVCHAADKCFNEILDDAEKQAYRDLQSTLTSFTLRKDTNNG